MNTQKFFESHPVFRFDEFEEFIKNRGYETTEQNAHSILYHHLKKGFLLNVRRGFYVVNYGNSYQPENIDPRLLAGRISEDAVLSYHTALESHGLAYSDFNRHVYFTKKQIRDFEFQGQIYKGVFPPTEISEKAYLTEVEEIKILDLPIKRTTLERTIVDVLDKPDFSGGWEEVWRSLERVTIFNVKAAIAYALKLGKASTVGKLGYFLDQRPDYLKVEESILSPLISNAPKGPYCIDKSLSKKSGSTYIRRWGILVPNYLHEKQWEEPEHDIDY